MPIPDDEQFEAYLKRFHPLAPEALRFERQRHTAGRWFVVAAGVVGAAAVLVASVLSLHSHPNRRPSPHPIENAASAEQLVNAQPLTMRRANALLATAPSFKAAVDEMAFPPKAAPLSKDERSALAVLSKEKSKL